MKRNTAGFTLIELMIVVEIIGILAVIALPQLIRSRTSSNEMSAVRGLHAILDAQISFNTDFGFYAVEFDALTSANPPYINGDWSGVRAGYQFEITGLGNNFAATATPEDFTFSGWRGFYVDASGVVRAQVGQAATAESPPLGTPGGG
jgi:prepilin-type N-terminal cleavage/methylation domain-containing protein